MCFFKWIYDDRGVCPPATGSFVYGEVESNKSVLRRINCCRDVISSTYPAGLCEPASTFSFLLEQVTSVS